MPDILGYETPSRRSIAQQTHTPKLLARRVRSPLPTLRDRSPWPAVHIELRRKSTRYLCALAYSVRGNACIRLATCHFERLGF